jgi:hypothetical protein
MAVLITAIVPGQTQEGYDLAMTTLRPLLDQAQGFIAHGAAFFAKYIHPHLPPGVTPKRTYLELHSLVVAPVASAKA